MTTAKHQILIVGGGAAGISVAARMLRKGYPDVAVIEPSSMHYYQPLWRAALPDVERSQRTAVEHPIVDEVERVEPPESAVTEA